MSDCCPTHEGCYDECPVCRLELAEEEIQRLEKENSQLREYIRIELSARGQHEPDDGTCTCQWATTDMNGKVTCKNCGRELLNE